MTLPEDEYEPDDYPSPTAAKLLRPGRRRFFVPVLVFIGAALLAAYGISRLEKPKPQPEKIEVEAPPKQQERMTEQQAEPVPPTEPFKSLVLDAAQSYLAGGGRPAATTTGRSR